MFIEVILSFIYPNNILNILLFFVYILIYFKSFFFNITIQLYLSLLIVYYIMLFYE